MRATGTLFLDDFGGIGASLSASPKYFDVMETFSTVGAKATLEALSAIKPGGKEQRREVEQEKLKQRAAIAAAAAQMKGLRETFTVLGSAVEAFFGEAVECGVVLDGEPPTLVRSLLDRTWLREPMPSLIQRYGTRSAAQFTIIGTVTKASWIAAPKLSDEERAAAAGVRVREDSDAEPAKVESNSIRAAILAAQTVFEQVRDGDDRRRR